MGWWKRFNNWIDGSIDKAATSPLQDWEPGPFIWVTSDPPTREECSDEKSPEESIAPVADPGLTSEPANDEKSDPGGEIGQNLSGRQGISDSLSGDVTTETTLEHADDLPGSTFRVFPNAGNHRNSYDSSASVARAVRARQRAGYYRDGVRVSGWDHVKVYKAETVWRDVTEDYVTP